MNSDSPAPRAGGLQPPSCALAAAPSGDFKSSARGLAFALAALCLLAACAVRHATTPRLPSVGVAIGCGADQNPNKRGTPDLADAQGREIASEVKRLFLGPWKELSTAPTARAKRIELDYDKLPNSTFAYHYPLPDHYLARNPHVPAPPPSVNLAVILGRLNPISAPLERFNSPQSLNNVTSACGLGVYRDTLLGAGFSQNLFICEPVHNLVRRLALTSSGVTFTAARAADEAASEFLASTDNWFRPEQTASRAAVLASYASVASLKGDATKGAAHFTASCAACHAYRGLGHALGSDLATFRTKPAGDFLAAILDPNAAIEPRYIAYNVDTKDDRALTGLVTDETATGLTLAQANSVKDKLLRSDVKTLRPSSLSLMPEGIEAALPPQAMADLLAWLRE